MDEIERKTHDHYKEFQSVLNELSPDNFKSMVHKVKSFVTGTDERLGGYVRLVFEKAISEKSSSEIYARMCKEIGGTMDTVPPVKKLSDTFKGRLVVLCQVEFERCLNDQAGVRTHSENPKVQLERDQQKVRQRAVGTIRFIGELYKYDQLPSSIMHICIRTLIEKEEDESLLEWLCKLLRTIGYKMENENDQDLEKDFKKLGEIVRCNEQHRFGDRVRCMIQDVIDLRRNGWNPHRQDLNPKTIKADSLQIVNMNEIDRKTQEVFEKFKCVLNELSLNNFGKMIHKVESLVIDTDERLDGCVKLVFEKAISEQSSSVLYAILCREVGTIAIVPSKEKRSVSFKSRLLAMCQCEFERRRKEQANAIRDARIKLEADQEPKDEFDQLKGQLEEKERKVRQRAIGTVRFVGELYIYGQLTSSIMHSCIKLLIEEEEDESSLECLCKLLPTIGYKMENENGQDLQKYFEKMDEFVRNQEQCPFSNRIRIIIQDVIDLRRNGWKPRRQDPDPKTLNKHILRGGGNATRGSLGSRRYHQETFWRSGNQNSLKGREMQQNIKTPSNDPDIASRFEQLAICQGRKNNSNNKENWRWGLSATKDGKMDHRVGDCDWRRNQRDRDQMSGQHQQQPTRSGLLTEQRQLPLSRMSQ